MKKYSEIKWRMMKKIYQLSWTHVKLDAYFGIPDKQKLFFAQMQMDVTGILLIVLQNDYKLRNKNIFKLCLLCCLQHRVVLLMQYNED